jgi:hypothetical protein
MKPFRFILVLAACALFGAVVSGIVTMISWGVRIEDRAFHCWDIGFGSYWTDIDLHKTAGDTISSGWTWEQIETVRIHYLEAFWLLCAVMASILFWFIHKLRSIFSLESSAVEAVRSAVTVHVANRRWLSLLHR